MEFNKYQQLCSDTAVYPDAYKILYPLMGLSGEVGEIMNKVKKIYRDKDGEFSAEFVKELGYELGDVLWYLAKLADDLDFNFDDIASNNLSKLQDRKRRGTLQGSGDKR